MVPLCCASFAVAVLTAFVLAEKTAPGSASAPVEHSQMLVRFDVPAGPVNAARAVQLFGNGSMPKGRDHVQIVDGFARVTFVKGAKVEGTGVALCPRVPARQRYTVQYRIRYGDDFESGLHGKQIGLSGGRGYTGGQGAAARENGDGWSIRLQFDARDADITNQLYVYHCDMPATYGVSLGTDKNRFSLKRGQWHTIRLTVTMQSSVDRKDGRIEAWCDGRKVIDIPDVRFVNREPGRQIDTLRFELFPGGGGNTPTRDNVVDVDDIEWSDQ
jgi:hypothetical protein